MKFTKMHGLGNCYIYVNCFEYSLVEESLPGIAEFIADVNFGIGADGMILICPSKVADFKMRIFNVDGSEGKNCGNGLRCVAKYVYERGLTKKTNFQIETLGGIVNADLDVHGLRVELVTIDMGEPLFLKKDLPMVGDPLSQTIREKIEVDGRIIEITALSVGNPHMIIYVDDIEEAPVEQLGPKLERHPLFPERVNVAFNQIISRDEMYFRVWERGSGITQACGTAACASVVAGVVNGLLDQDIPITVHLLGGDLEITYNRNGKIYMTGPAAVVADGEIYI